MSDERFVAIETKLDTLTAGQDALAAGQQAMDERLSGQIAALDHQMRVLHEDTITKLKEEIEQRLAPLEAFARNRRPD